MGHEDLGEEEAENEPTQQAPGNPRGRQRGKSCGFRELSGPVSSSGGLACWANLPAPEPGRRWGRALSGRGWIEIAAPIWAMRHGGAFQSLLWRGSILGEMPVNSLGDGGLGKGRSWG